MSGWDGTPFLIRTPKGPAEVRIARLDADAHELVELFTRVFEDWRATPETWRWKYLPPWAERIYAVVGTHEGRIVSHIGAIPVPGWICGEPRTFFQVADVMVRKDLRGKYDWFDGERLLPEFIFRHHADAVLYGFTDSARLQFYNWIGGTKLVDEPRIARVRAGDVPLGALRAEPWEFSDDRLDPLWDALSSAHATGLRRDAAYVRWRYGARPGWKYRLVGVLRDGRAIGWSVVLDRGERATAGEPAWAVDFLLPPDDLAAGLAATAAVAADAGLVAWIPSALEQRFRETRPAGCSAVAWKPARDVGRMRRGLFYTAGDSDMF